MLKRSAALAFGDRVRESSTEHIRGSGRETLLEPPSEPDGVPASGRTGARGRGGAVLVVDDERAIRAATTRGLAARGFAVTCAAGADEAVREFDRLGGAIDVLVADVSLEGRSGLELADELRARNPRMSVLYVSGSAPETVMTESRLIESAFLPKPFTIEELTDVLRELIETARRD